MPLFLLGTGEVGTITNLTGNTVIRQFLTERGFCVGKSIRILQRTFGDNVIIGLGDLRVAIHKKLTNHIQITIKNKHKEIADAQAYGK